MTIRTRILVVTVPTLLLAVIVTTAAAVIAIRRRYETDAIQYRSEEMRKIRGKLKNLVDTAYTVIESNYKKAQNKEYIEKIYGRRLKDIVGIAESIVEEMIAKVKLGKLSEAEAKKQACEAIRKIRYDNGTGYVWINDVGKPFPKMIMHPFSPELEGKILDDPKYNCALGRNENLFKAFVDVCEANGEGFVNYRWPKPKPDVSDLTTDVPKLSYVRLVKQWQWILGTGVYIDDVLVEALEKSKDDIRRMRYDNGTGYFWINDISTPYPKMVMHPFSPELEGEILDDPQYNCALGKDENIFKAFVNVCQADREGFVDYKWPKPTEKGLTEPMPKLSYVKLYQPLGWIVGTGVYTDSIDTEIRERTEMLMAQVNSLIEKVIFFSAIMCLLSIAASVVSAKTISSPVGRLVETMRAIRHEGLSKKRTKPGGASEIRELGGIFNSMLDAIDEAVEKLAKETETRTRMQHDLDIARSIQKGLMPSNSPQIEQFDIAGWSQPADETGGDYYDWQPLSDGRLAISLADVTGHGIGPALVTAVCRAYSRASFPSGQELGIIMGCINELLFEDLPDERFVTFVVALLDLRNSSIEMLSAGHGPLFLYTAANELLQNFNAHNIPLGLIPDIKYDPPQLIHMEPGDMLVLLTDGFFEWMNADGQQFGLDRLQQAILETKDLPAEEIISRLYSRVKQFVGDQPQQDDLTVVIIKRKIL